MPPGGRRQPGDVGLDGPGRSAGTSSAHTVDEPADVDGQVRRQRGEEPPLSGGSDADRTCVAREQQRPQDAECGHPAIDPDGLAATVQFLVHQPGAAS